MELHRIYATRYRHAATKTEQNGLEKVQGCRYSALLDLPYFNPMRMCIIDPMHNLLLGTGKHIICVWKEHGLLSSQQLDEIQQKVDSFTVPDDVGRIPTKISSGFSGFKAEQWRNWTILFSLYCLKDINTIIAGSYL